MPEVPSLSEFKGLNPDQKLAQIHQRLYEMVLALLGFGGAVQGAIGNPGQLQIKAAEGAGFAPLPYAGWTGTTLEMPTQRLYRAKTNSSNYDRLYTGWDSFDSRWTIQQERAGTFPTTPLMVRAGTQLILASGDGTAVSISDESVSPLSGVDVRLGTSNDPFKAVHARAIMPGSRNVETTTTVTDSDHTLLISADTGDLTIFLPVISAEMDGMEVFLKRTDSNAGAEVTISAAGFNIETLPTTLSPLGEEGSGLLLKAGIGWMVMARS